MAAQSNARRHMRELQPGGLSDILRGAEVPVDPDDLWRALAVRMGARSVYEFVQFILGRDCPQRRWLSSGYYTTWRGMHEGKVGVFIVMVKDAYTLYHEGDDATRDKIIRKLWSFHETSVLWRSNGAYTEPGIDEPYARCGKSGRLMVPLGVRLKLLFLPIGRVDVITGALPGWQPSADHVPLPICRSHLWSRANHRSCSAVTKRAVETMLLIKNRRVMGLSMVMFQDNLLTRILQSLQPWCGYPSLRVKDGSWWENLGLNEFEDCKLQLVGGGVLRDSLPSYLEVCVVTNSPLRHMNFDIGVVDATGKHHGLVFDESICSGDVVGVVFTPPAHGIPGIIKLVKLHSPKCYPGGTESLSVRSPVPITTVGPFRWSVRHDGGEATEIHMRVGVAFEMFTLLPRQLTWMTWLKRRAQRADATPCELDCAKDRSTRLYGRPGVHWTWESSCCSRFDAYPGFEYDKLRRWGESGFRPNSGTVHQLDPCLEFSVGVREERLDLINMYDRAKHPGEVHRARKLRRIRANKPLYFGRPSIATLIQRWWRRIRRQRHYHTQKQSFITGQADAYCWVGRGILMTVHKCHTDEDEDSNTDEDEDSDTDDKLHVVLVRMAFVDSWDGTRALLYHGSLHLPNPSNLPVKLVVDDSGTRIEFTSITRSVDLIQEGRMLPRLRGWSTHTLQVPHKHGIPIPDSAVQLDAKQGAAYIDPVCDLTGIRDGDVLLGADSEHDTATTNAEVVDAVVANNLKRARPWP